jgi:hypothetical protein
MRRALLLTTLLVSVALLAQQTRPSAQPTFPTVNADSLDNTKVSLPADFTKPLNLLVLSFARDQQDGVETWIDSFKKIEGSHPQVQLWVLPVSSREDVIYKWWLNSSIRGNLAKDESPRFTVPLYVNKPQFRKVLSIPSEKQVVVLLTNKAGVVLWRADGSANDTFNASLTGFLTSSPLAR